MSAIDKFCRMTSSDRRLLIGVFLLMTALRVGIACAPWTTVLGMAERLLVARPRKHRFQHIDLERITWAVHAASRCIRGARCLPQALAAYLLLKRRGCTTELKIGVIFAKGGLLTAHSWLERNGTVVFGGLRSLGLYVRLPLDHAEGAGMRRGHWRAFG